MSGYTKFDSEIYSEELFPTDEREFDVVMNAAPLDDDWTGYADWSEGLDQTDVDNLTITEDGKVIHKAEPKSNGRLDGIEL
jgi:hypothetical protein